MWINKPSTNTSGSEKTLWATTTTWAIDTSTTTSTMQSIIPVGGIIEDETTEVEGVETSANKACLAWLNFCCLFFLHYGLFPNLLVDEVDGWCWDQGN